MFGRRCQVFFQLAMGWCSCSTFFGPPRNLPDRTMPIWLDFVENCFTTELFKRHPRDTVALRAEGK